MKIANFWCLFLAINCTKMKNSKIFSDSFSCTPKTYLHTIFEKCGQKWKSVRVSRSFSSKSLSKPCILPAFNSILALTANLYMSIKSEPAQELGDKWALSEMRKDRSIRYVKIKEKGEMRFFELIPTRSNFCLTHANILRMCKTYFYTHTHIHRRSLES